MPEMSNVVNVHAVNESEERFSSVPGAKSSYVQFALENVANVSPMDERSKSPSKVRFCAVVIDVVPSVTLTSSPTCVARPSTIVHDVPCGVTVAFS